MKTEAARPEEDVAVLVRPATSVGSIAVALIQSARPKQWTKNGLIFVALVFSVNRYWQAGEPLQYMDLIASSSLAFLGFSVLSSSIYFLNDVFDVKTDQLHPKKRLRPIAAGLINIPTAVSAFVVLLIGGLAISLVVSPVFAGLALLYAVLMVGYSAWLKHVVLLDLFIVASGFVLRAAAGAVALDVPISPWLYICTMLGALFIVVAKRRNEISTLADRAKDHRPILAFYPLEFVDQMIAILATAIVVAYSIYTFTAEGLPSNGVMMLTIPFVLYGVFRYLYLVYVEDGGGAPEDLLLRDRPLLVNTGLWLASSATILLFSRL